MQFELYAYGDFFCVSQVGWPRATPLTSQPQNDYSLHIAIGITQQPEVRFLCYLGYSNHNTLLCTVFSLSSRIGCFVV
jgi:hypothetical protein